jgi:integrase/recombinase XerC
VTKPNKKKPPKHQRPISCWITRYDRHLEAINYSPMTRKQYRHRLGLFVRFLRQDHGQLSPQAVTAVHIGTYQAWLSVTRRKPSGGRLAVGTQCQCLAPIKSFFAWLYKRGVLAKNPTQELVLPTKSKSLPRDVPTTKEVQTVINSLLTSRKRYHLYHATVIGTLYATGMRKMELARLRFADLDLENREVRIEVTKNREGRISFLTPWAAQLLRAYIEQEALDTSPQFPVFPAKRGGGTASGVALGSSVRRAFRQIKDKNITCHCLRHAFCLSLLRGGASIRVVAELAGHRRLSNTAIYTKLDLADLRKVHDRIFLERKDR